MNATQRLWSGEEGEGDRWYGESTVCQRLSLWRGEGERRQISCNFRIPNRPTLRRRDDDGPALGDMRHRRPSEEERPVAACQKRLVSCRSHVGLDCPVELLGRDVRDIGDGILRATISGADQGRTRPTRRTIGREPGSAVSRRGVTSVTRCTAVRWIDRSMGLLLTITDALFTSTSIRPHWVTTVLITRLHPSSSRMS